MRNFVIKTAFNGQPTSQEIWPGTSAKDILTAALKRAGGSNGEVTIDAKSDKDWASGVVERGTHAHLTLTVEGA